MRDTLVGPDAVKHARAAAEERTMFETVFRSKDLPKAERFERWRQLTFASHAPTDLRTDHETDFNATLRLLELGPVQVSMLTCPPLCSHRTPKLIRQSDPELYHLALTRRGTVGVDQTNRETALETGELTLSTTSWPYRGQVTVDEGEVTLVQALIPRALMPLPADLADRLLAVRLPAREGPGALFSHFIDHLATDPTDYAPRRPRGWAAWARPGRVTACPPPRHHSRSPTRDPPARPGRAHPRLHPPAPGRAAPRPEHDRRRSPHLNPLPAPPLPKQGITVTAFIRQHRLERARRDLVDPTQITRPIYAVAARWGFRRPADFTRAFRTAFGLPPSEYRHLALHDRTGAAR
ncbi:AraC family transcriptional regulator [Streptomyces sp. M19]